MFFVCCGFFSRFPAPKFQKAEVLGFFSSSLDHCGLWDLLLVICGKGWSTGTGGMSPFSGSADQCKVLVK